MPESVPVAAGAGRPPAAAVKPVDVLLRAAILGPTAALAVALFVVVEHEVRGVLWEDLPAALGMAEPDWWWVLAVLVAGAALTSLALRLPGSGGHSPLDGFGFDIGPRQIGSVLAAALASLSFGAVLGPEAPALAIGTALGAVMARAGRGAADPRVRPLLMLAGGAAAFGLVLGNPLAVALFVVEAALLGRRASPAFAMLPVAVALALGFLVQAGVADWPGIGETVLAVPGLGPYPEVQLVDLLLGVPLAMAVAAFVAVPLHSARWLRTRWSAAPTTRLLVAAVGVAGAAVLARGLTGETIDTVLFSGQSAIPTVLASTSVTALLVIAFAKAIAYALSLGSGFRGGQIFPAVYLGTTLAATLALLVPATTLQGLMPAAVAAAAAATMRLPFSAALLAVLLTSASGDGVMVPALIGAVVGLLTASALDRLRATPAVPPAGAAAQEQAVGP
jgi:H+/Cl- antiporter ClcA